MEQKAKSSSKSIHQNSRIFFLIIAFPILLIFVSQIHANEPAEMNQNGDEYISPAYTLPRFVLPYSRDTTVYWTGGPHEYGNLNGLGKFASGHGSGMDFANGHFEVLAMATGTVEKTYCINSTPSLGCLVAVRHFPSTAPNLYRRIKAVQFDASISSSKSPIDCVGRQVALVLPSKDFAL